MYILNHSNIKDAIKILNKYGSKTIIVTDKNKKLIGTLSDGDIRKSTLRGLSLKDSIKGVYNKKPIYVKQNHIDLKKIKKIFIKKKVDLIPVIDSKKKLQK